MSKGKHKFSNKCCCIICGKEFSTMGLSTHILRSHEKDPRFDSSGNHCNKGQNQFTTGKSKGHSLESRQKIRSSNIGKTHSDITKKIISEKQKIAHKEGRAWNIGMNRWKKQPSYPESFFMKVIENDFIDKNYRREVWFGKFVIDFMWEHKKKAIEIDGKQHENFDQKNRDQRKDMFLNQNGIEVLRIKWKDMFNNVDYWVNIAKQFIDGCLV